MQATMMIQGEEEKPDELNLTIREPDEEDIGRIRAHQGNVDSSLQVEVAAEE